LFKKERRLQDYATYVEIVSNARAGDPSVTSDSRPHLIFCECAILIAECFPDDTGGQDRREGKETTTHNVVIWTVQFEEEWLSRLEPEELTITARLPEVNLVQPVQTRQVVEPITIPDADEEAHGFRL